MKANRGNDAVLTRAQDITRAANFKVSHGNIDARAKLCLLGDCLKAGAGLFGESLERRMEEVRIRPIGAPTDPASKLVQLRQAKMIGAIHNQGVGIGDIQPRFDNTRADQNIDLAFRELLHHCFELMFSHLTVADGYAGFEHDFLKAVCLGVDGLDAIVDEEDLPTAIHFPEDSLADQVIVAPANVIDNGKALFRSEEHTSELQSPTNL